jgi:tetratricopeptide (TPR) repeat protein
MLPLHAAADAFERTWCELDAGEFRLVTDRPRADAEDMVWRMQMFRPVAEGYLPGVPNDTNPPLRVVVFGDGRDYRRAIDGADVAGYMLPALDGNLMVVGPDPFARSEHEALLHEYVHYLLRTRTDINIPIWFDEGLAGLLSTAEISDRGVVIGALPSTYLATMIEQGRLRLQQAIAADDLRHWRGARLRAFYAWSWLLTHRLLLGQEAGLPDWRGELTAYLAGEQPSLPDALEMSSRALERSLERYRDRGGSQRTHEVDASVERDARYRCLDDNEKTIEIALAILPHNAEGAAHRLRERVAADPDAAGLWVALSLAEEGTGDRDAAVIAARTALLHAPEDVSATVRLASALVMGCILTVSAECRARWQESAPLLRRSLRDDPARQDAIFMLGLAYLYSGRPGDALNYLRIAYRRQPWAAPINFYLGESYRLIGDRRRALEHLQRTRQWAHTELWRVLADAALAQMEP